MLNADRAPYFETCPRCGIGGLEILSTHSFCVNCNYFCVSDPDEMLSIPDWVFAYLKAEKIKSKPKQSAFIGLEVKPPALIETAPSAEMKTESTELPGQIETDPNQFLKTGGL